MFISSHLVRPRRFVGLLLVLAMVVTVVAVFSAAPASGTVPGDNGDIAYQRGASIWTMNADGSDQVALTNTGGGIPLSFHSEPAWSPDGTKIVFRNSPVLGGFTDDILVMNADGSGAVNLTNTSGIDEFDPAWSPDGAMIAYQRGASIWTMNADGSDQVALTNTGGGILLFRHFEPAWSPDGTMIAYRSSSILVGTFDEIAAVNVDGTGGANLTNTPSVSESNPDWQTITPPLVPDTVGLVDVSSGAWHLRSGAGAVTSFLYGNPGDLPISGDWDGDGDSTPGLYRQSDGFFYSRNSNDTGVADAECFAGDPSDVPIAGDWDGDGDDNLGIYRPSEQMFYLFTVTCTGTPMGAAQISFLFGNPGDKPVAGDWDGDGIDEVGLHRESTGFFYWRNTLDTGVADGEIFFGDPNDRFVAGDWGVVDGADTPGLFRPSDVTFYFRHTLTQGVADSQFTWTGAGSGWLPVAGQFGLG